MLQPTARRKPTFTCAPKRGKLVSWPSSLLAILVVLAAAFSAYPGVTDTTPAAAASPVEAWSFWKYEDVKGLDPWGDSKSDATDIVAVYFKHVEGRAYFRVDLMDMRQDGKPELYLAIDYKPGGNSALKQLPSAPVADIPWDLLLSSPPGGAARAMDATYVDRPASLTGATTDPVLDYVEFALSPQAMEGWDGSPFRLQALVTDSSGAVSDRTAVVSSAATTGRAKLVLLFGNMLGAPGPNGISAYDGFGHRQGERPGVRRGLKYLLDAVEKYRIPVTTNDLRVDTLYGNEYLGIGERLRSLAEQGLFDGLDTLTYGYYWPWQPADVDARAVRLAQEYRQRLGMPRSKVFYPYEAHVTMADLTTIREAGYSGVYAIDKYGFWFGWITDWSIPNVGRDWNENMKKVHRIDGVLVFPGLQGFVWDERWNSLGIEPGWHPNHYSSYVGTDGGLHHAWRRGLLDMALDPDQEKYITMGTDLGLTSWMFQEDVEGSARWLASHPWVEAVSLSDLAGRNWTPIDHGDMGLTPDQPLDQHFDFSLHGEAMGVNDYFWQNYYGGVSDGHSSLVPAGTRIEAYFDYVPTMRNGQSIPSGMKMGDDKTPGTIIHETLRNLRAAPDNSLARLAWSAYFKNVAEGTMHASRPYRSGEDPVDDPGGAYLNSYAKVRASDVRQANKVVAAARWAEAVAQGAVPTTTRVSVQDLDLDGEDEYVMSNDRVFAIFENDGGRLEYAFAYDPATGPVQLVAPWSQWATWFGTAYGEGESPWPGGGSSTNETAFEDLNWNEGEFRYLVYDATRDGQSLTFVSPDGRIAKTFSLKDNTVTAGYVIKDLDYLVVGFGLTVNLDSMYSLDWWEKLSKVSSAKAVGWTNSAGGYAVVDWDGAKLERAESFLETAVRQEMKEREDPASNGAPYWMVFPLHNVKVEGQRTFEVGLTLAGLPPKSAEPGIQTATSTAPGGPPSGQSGATPTAGAAPAQQQDSKRGGLGPLIVVGMVLALGIAAFLVLRKVRRRT